jgi:predicted lipoprotein with Yx(FWY)xxD motif
MENEEVEQMHTRSHQSVSGDAIASAARTRMLAVMLAAALGLAGFLVATSTARSANRSDATVSLRKTTLGMVLVAANGHTIYLFGKDRHDKSACSASCAQFWPPLLSRGKPTAGPGVRATLLGTTTRPNGTVQVSYNKHPLYTYVLDKRAGQTKGAGFSAFGAKWYAVSANGVAIIKSTTTTPTTTSTTTTTTPYP